jgi:cyanophycin synthetase
MRGLWLNSAALQSLYLFELARAFLFFRNAKRRELRRHRLAFNERVWREAAETLGASWRSLGGNISEISLNGVRTRVSDYASEIDSPVTCALLHEKPLVHQILRQHDLPVPRHACFSLNDVGPALAFLQSSQRNCVVKPANGSGAGRGISTGIRCARHLARAAGVAAVYSDALLIEEQVPGESYRLLYLDGQLIDALVRRPPSIVGDGRSSIARLVRCANEQRVQDRAATSQALIPMDFDMRRTLAKQGMSPRSVPAKGQRVTLKMVVNDNCGSDNSTATLDPSIVEAGRRAVKVLRVRFAGVDIMTSNPSLPLEEAGGVILEVNATPGLYYHYHKSDGAFPAALYVLRRLLQEDVPQRDPENEQKLLAGILI